MHISSSFELLCRKVYAVINLLLMGKLLNPF